MRICDLFLQFITKNKLQVFYNNLQINGAEEETIPLKCADEKRFAHFFLP